VESALQFAEVGVGNICTRRELTQRKLGGHTLRTQERTKRLQLAPERSVGHANIFALEQARGRGRGRRRRRAATISSAGQRRPGAAATRSSPVCGRRSLRPSTSRLGGGRVGVPRPKARRCTLRLQPSADVACSASQRFNAETLASGAGHDDFHTTARSSARPHRCRFVCGYSIVAVTSASWSPRTKIAAKYLAPYLQARERLATSAR